MNLHTLGRLDRPFVDGVVPTPVGDVPRVGTALGAGDRLGTLRVRLGIGRDRYTVTPGLYAVGQPSAASPVLLSANYKLSFDTLRSVLGQHDVWILVLDTRGINVWCAAGKGTFGTAEIVRRVQATALDQIVSHRKLIAPQLGAPGIRAHEVKSASGFRINYGPVRADDLPRYLDTGMQVTPAMRRVRFGLRDRALLVPVEMVGGAKYALGLALLFALLGGLSAAGYSLVGVQSTGLVAAAVVLATFVGATVLGPLLLPLLPGRAFALKGALLGAALFTLLLWLTWPGLWTLSTVLHLAGWALLITALSSFALMNFTGATTFTSLSGVLREMKVALPLQIGGAVAGLALWLSSLFVRGGGAL